MGKLPITLVIRDYEYLAYLAYGDVVPEGIDLKLDRDNKNALSRWLNDPSVLVGEISLGRHLVNLGNGIDSGFVGIPFFPHRSFRHRNFFVRRDSGFRELKDLQGKRMGIDEWPSTANCWGRAALREGGVRIEGLQWWVGSIDGTSAGRPQGNLPPYVRPAETGRYLRDMLLAGELDALMCPIQMARLGPDSPVVRLFPDYVRVEQEYFRRTGIWPAHHIVAIRRELLDRNPWVARSLYDALDQAVKAWLEARRQLPELPPWLQAELEEVVGVMGENWRPSGIEPNRAMVQALCDDLFAQGMMPKPLDGSLVFREYEQIVKG